MGTLSNSEDSDEMQFKMALHQGLHYVLRQIQSSGIGTRHFIEILTGNSLKYKME